MIRMMCGVRLVDRVLTDVLCDSVSVAVKNGDMIIKSCQRWYGHAMCEDINSQICKVMEVEITEKKYVKKDLKQYGLRRKDVDDQKICGDQIKAKIPNPNQLG